MFDTDMDKRSATISIRVPPELEHQLQMIAAARETTLSDLGCQQLALFVEGERFRYLKLREAFEGERDLPDQSGQQR